VYVSHHLAPLAPTMHLQKKRELIVSKVAFFSDSSKELSDSSKELQRHSCTSSLVIVPYTRHSR
jgi:hypothetical protein